MSYTVENIENEGSEYRARVVVDEDSYDAKPDGDFFGTVYQMDRDGSVSTLGTSYGVGDPDLGRIIGWAWSAERDMDHVEAILRGTLNVCAECGSGLSTEADWTETCPSGNEETDLHVPEYEHESVVGFDYIDRDYGKMLNVVTMADLKMWGFESVEEYRQKTGHNDPSHGNLTEWRAWADGDVFYIVIERRVLDRHTIVTMSGDVVQSTEDETWEIVESLHGFYDSDYAKQEAAAMLAGFEKEES